MSYLVPSRSVTSTVLSFWRISACSIAPWSICARNSGYVGLSACSSGEMSRWAKNANTTTMRIGKAALLKNRLMESPGSLPRVQRGHVGQVAVSLGMIEPVTDDEPVRDLEANVLGGDLCFAPSRLGEPRAHLERR